MVSYGVKDNATGLVDTQQESKPVCRFGHLKRRRIEVVYCTVQNSEPTFVEFDPELYFGVDFSWKVVLVKLGIYYVSQSRWPYERVGCHDDDCRKQPLVTAIPESEIGRLWEQLTKNDFQPPERSQTEIALFILYRKFTTSYQGVQLQALAFEPLPPFLQTAFALTHLHSQRASQQSKRNRMEIQATAFCQSASPPSREQGALSGYLVRFRGPFV